MKNLQLILALFFTFVGGVSSAHATSVTYTFTGNGILTGTNFTYVSTAGFLSFDTGILAPTTATPLFYAGFNEGVFSGFDFVSATSYQFYGTPSGNNVSATVTPYQISSFTPSESLSFGTLSITTTPAATVTPEPSSLLLLGTGAIGVIGACRRRIQVSRG